MQRLLRALAVCVEANIPVLLIGEPGVGKTSTVVSLAHTLGLKPITVILSLFEPTDITGLPFIKDGAVHFAPPTWLQGAATEPSLLFLDELSQATPPVQAAALRLVLERQVHDVQLHPGTRIIAAANPGYNTLLEPLINRFVVLTWEPDPEQWLAGFLSDAWPTVPIHRLHLPNPDALRTHQAFVKSLISTFIRKNPSALLTPPDKRGDGPFASPRSWDMLARLLTVARATNNWDLLHVLASGLLDQGTAIEFLAHVLNSDYPDPHEYLENPQAPLPERHDQIVALLSGLAALAQDQESWEKAWVIIDRIRVEVGIDLALYGARPLVETFRSRARGPNPLTLNPTVAKYIAPLREALNLIQGLEEGNR